MRGNAGAWSTEFLLQEIGSGEGFRILEVAAKRQEETRPRGGRREADRVKAGLQSRRYVYIIVVGLGHYHLMGFFSLVF